MGLDIEHMSEKRLAGKPYKLKIYTDYNVPAGGWNRPPLEALPDDFEWPLGIKYLYIERDLHPNQIDRKEFYSSDRGWRVKNLKGNPGIDRTTTAHAAELLRRYAPFYVHQLVKATGMHLCSAVTLHAQVPLAPATCGAEDFGQYLKRRVYRLDREWSSELAYIDIAFTNLRNGRITGTTWVSWTELDTSGSVLRHVHIPQTYGQAFLQEICNRLRDSPTQLIGPGRWDYTFRVPRPSAHELINASRKTPLL